jgi:hypothetical protein
MSSDEAADNAEDPGHPRFIIMHATETFDGRERVMSRAAYDLQVLATAHSASCGHPGFVPDDYLEHLDGLAIETTITAVELCTVGMWERVDGGYRVLDWEAVEVCLDQVRQRRGEDEQALAWEREREALVQAQMAQPMVVTPSWLGALAEVLAGGCQGLLLYFYAVPLLLLPTGCQRFSRASVVRRLLALLPGPSASRSPTLFKIIPRISREAAGALPSACR